VLGNNTDQPLPRALAKNQALERETELVEGELDTLLAIQLMLPASCPASGQHCLEC